MAIDTGAVGEKFVDFLAARAEFTVSKSTQDKEGWDLILQRTPAKQHALEPLDQMPPQVTCFVQVKSTIAGTQSEKVTLANWARMAKSPVPWFFMRVVMDASGEPLEMYLVHVDQALIRATLKRLTELPSDASASELSRRTMQLTWHDAHRLAPPFYRELSSRILECVGDMHDYTTKKSEFVRTVGYGAAPYSVIFRPKVDSTAADAYTAALADFSVGILKQLPVSIIRTVETRFGLQRPARGPASGDATIEAPNIPSVGKTKVTIEDGGSTRVTLDCETYLSNVLLPKLPKKYQRVRFVAPSAEILIAGWDTANISWQYPDGVAPLSHFVDAAKLLRVLASPSELRVSVRKDGRNARLRAGPTRMNFSSYELQEAELFIAAEKVAREYGLEPRDIQVDGATIVREGPGLRVMAAVMGRASGPLEVNLTVTERDAPRPNVGDPAGCVVPTALRLGDYVLAAVLFLTGKVTSLSVEGDKYAFAIDDAHVELSKTEVFDSTSYDEQQFLADARSIFEERVKVVDFLLFKPPLGEAIIGWAPSSLLVEGGAQEQTSVTLPENSRGE